MFDGNSELSSNYNYGNFVENPTENTPDFYRSFSIGSPETKILFITGNGKFWAMCNYNELKQLIDQRTGDEQANCDFLIGKNDKVFTVKGNVLSRDWGIEDPWISAEGSHSDGLGIHEIIWGEVDFSNGTLDHEALKNENGGINVYIGTFNQNDSSKFSPFSLSPPTLSTFAAPVTTGNEDDEITVTLANLIDQGDEADIYVSVDGFLIKAISSGVLKIGSSAETATAWDADTNNLIDASHNAYWTAAKNANGNLNAFTVVAKDNYGLTSETPVQVKIDVKPFNDVPIGGGLSSLSFFDFAGGDIGSVAVMQPDGKILLAGYGSGDGFIARYNVDGSLDETFGLNGWLRSSVESYINAIVVQADEKLLVGGSAHGPGCAIQRYNYDGSVDQSFGENGTIQYQFFGDNYDSLTDIKLLADGKIIAIIELGNSTLGLAKFNTDGTPDLSFGHDGFVIPSDVGYQGGYDWAAFVTPAKMIVQPDGKILACGDALSSSYQRTFMMVRYNADGSLDNSFSSDGWAGDQFGVYGSADSIALQADGKILVAGISSGDFTVLRLNTNGSLDTSFAQSGIYKLDLKSSFDYVRKVVVQEDGKILLAGRSGGDIAVVRLNVDGTIDTHFGTAGQFVADLRGYPDEINDVILRTDGGITLIGNSIPNDDDGPDAFIVRYDSTGVFITGLARQGETLKAGNNLSDADGIPNSGRDAIVYQWQADGVNIFGAIGDSFLLTKAEVGKTITVVASYTDLQGTAETVTSTATQTVSSYSFAPTLTTFTGPVAAGNEDSEIAVTFANLQANGDEADLDGSVDGFVIRAIYAGSLRIGSSSETATAWAVGSNDVVDAQHQAFWTPPANANGQQMAFAVVAKDDSGLISEIAVPALINVTSVNDAPTLSGFAAPVTTGNKNAQITVKFADLQAQGNEADIDGLTTAFVIKAVSSGTLRIGTSTKTATAWNAVTNNVIDISHSAFWTPTANTKGNINAFTVVAKDNEGLRSNTPVQVKVRVNELPTGSVTITGSIAVGQTLTASNTLQDTDGLEDISYQWKVNGVDVSKSGSYTITQADIGKAISVTASYIDLQGTLETVSSKSSVLVAVNLIGTAGDDVLNGNLGDDTLNGGLGNDKLSGGMGNDSFIIGSGIDTIADLGAGGADSLIVASGATANATVTAAWIASATTFISGVANISSAGFTVNLGAVTASNSGFKVTNTGVATSFIGSKSVDTLIGGTGNDTIDGGAGDDSLTGGAGADNFIIASGTDTITDLGAGGADVLVVGSGATANAITKSAWIATAASSNNGAVNVSTSGLAVNLALVSGTNGFTVTNTGVATTLTGSASFDTLIGGNGNDTLVGGAGNDLLKGGLGNDTYVIDSLDDVIAEMSGAGTDVAQVAITTAGLTYIVAGNVENAKLTKDVDFNLTGNIQNNVLTGNLANNVLDGGSGLDTLIGGAGNDTYIVDLIAETATIQDTITELANAGTDTIQLRGKYTGLNFAVFTLATNLENLDASKTESSLLNLTGNTAANILIGNAAANNLDGGLGADTLIGGLGDDNYSVDNTGDVITESKGEGIDFVQSSASYTLSTNIENLTLIGTADIDATGNEFANILIGNNGNNILNGGAAADTLLGGAGNDTYVVDDAGDLVYETTSATSSFDAGGVDLIQVAIEKAGASYVLGSFIEKATLTNTVAFKLTGNSINNTLTGNAADNILDGGLGVDTLLGGDGNDAYIVDLNFSGVFDDILTESASAGTDTVQLRGAYSNASAATLSLAVNFENLDLQNTGSSLLNLTGNSVNNVLIGNAAGNVINGGSGADTLLGGAGNDTYVVDDLGDVIYESTTATSDVDAGGVDLVQVAIATAGGTYVLNPFIEKATLTNAVAFNLTGNTVNNALTGNAYANILDGGVGVDSLVGGLGDDAYIVDLTAVGALEDTLTEAANSGADTIQLRGVSSNASAATLTLVANFENVDASNSGSSLLNLTGNTVSNLLIGNAANNVLNGGTGADTLVGGAGNDTYVIDNIGDLVYETTTTTSGFDAGGIDLVQVGIVTANASYTLSDFVEKGTLTNKVAFALLGNSLNNTLTGNAAANSLVGGNGVDTLVGGAGDDALDGGAGNDVLTGGDGNDVLIGGLGNDNLTGNAGSDLFVFNTAPNTSNNKDTITDFLSVTDKLQFSKAVFAGLGTQEGGLNAGQFWSSASATSAHDADDRLLYNTTSGGVYYDADGQGGVGAIQIAVIGTTTHPSLINTDIQIIA